VIIVCLWMVVEAYGSRSEVLQDCSSNGTSSSSIRHVSNVGTKSTFNIRDQSTSVEARLIGTVHFK
jgi:hypothetical protein